MPYPVGAALRRRMGVGKFYHYGIASEYFHPETKRQMVYQFGGPYEGPEREGLRMVNVIWPTKRKESHTGVHIGLTPYDLFSEGRDVEVVEVPDNPIPVLQRAKEMIHRTDYHPAYRNCEHFTNFALSGTWNSKQSDELRDRAASYAGLMLLAGVFGSTFKW